MLSTTFMDLAIAAGLGLLVGLQKERADSPLAGLRTFALVSLAGAVAAIGGATTTPWVIVGGLLAIAALMVAGNVVLVHSEDADDPGQTTEVAVVLMYLIGVMVVAGSREVAIVLGASTAMLLHLREELVLERSKRVSQLRPAALSGCAEVDDAESGEREPHDGGDPKHDQKACGAAPPHGGQGTGGWAYTGNRRPHDPTPFDPTKPMQEARTRSVSAPERMSPFVG